MLKTSIKRLESVIDRLNTLDERISEAMYVKRDSQIVKEAVALDTVKEWREAVASCRVNLSMVLDYECELVGVSRHDDAPG